MIAAKHFDPVLGVDVHIIQPPGPVPPVPVPHPFVGMLIDPTEYAPIIGGTVKVNGMMRGVAGTGGKAIPSHIPIGGVFVMPPGNECEMFMGSTTVTFDGDPQSRLGDPALSCQSVGMPSIPRLKMHAKPKTLMLPTSVVLAVPAGPPVLVGGPPTISLMGMAMKFGMAILGKLLKKLRALQKASKKWKALSDKMRKGMNHLLDKIPGGQKMKGMVSNAICSLTGHPVDVATGKVTTEVTDVELPGPLPFTFSRVWYSQSTYQGPLGHGWHHTYDLGLYRFPEGVVVRLADGRFVVFEPPVPGEPSFDRTEKLLLHLTDRGYHAETLDGLVYHFGWPAKDGSELPLDHVRDPNDNRIVLERDRGRLVAFVDSGGRRLPVTTDAAGRITEIRVPDPDRPGETYPMASFRYDRRGDLVQADDALGHPFKYEYLDHLLVRETDRSGLAFYFMYDGSGPDAKCLRTWGDGNLFLRDLSYDPARQRTEVTDSLRHKTVYEWNAAGLVVKHTDPLGGVTLTEWSPHNDKLSTTDPNGAKTAFEYDDFGRLVSVTDPTGATVSYEYDAAGNAVKFTDPNGSVWKRECDARRNVTAVVDPLGSRWGFVLNDRGQPVRATDPLGHAAEFGWTGAGLMAHYVNRVGGRTEFTYDTAGRPASRTDATGLTTRFSHDRRGLLAEIIDGVGRRFRFRQTPAGHLSERTDAAGRTITYSHGPLGRVTSVRTAGGRTIRYRFDTEGQLSAVEPDGGSAWEYIRDAAGLLIEERTSDGRTLRTRFDAAGRAVETINGRGQRVTLQRNKAGRVVSRTLPDGSREEYAFDPGGRLLSAKNAAAEVRRAYDRCGRLASETVNGRTVRRAYDPAGRVTRRTSPLGRTLGLDYDPEGRLVGVVDGTAPLFRSTVDATGRERRRETPGGARWEWDTRPDGQPVAVRVGGAGGFVRRYSYTPTGEPSGQSDDLFGDTAYSHDADGYLTAERRPEGEEEFSYDPAGNIRPRAGVTVRRDADGNVVEKSGPNGQQRFEYDPLGRLTDAHLSDGRRVRFAYDPLGRRVRKGVGQAVTEYLWDGDTPLGEWGADRVEYLMRPGSFEPLARFDADGASVLECDPVGLPRSATTPDGRVVWRGDFDAFGRVRAEARRPGHVAVRYPGQWADPETGLSYNWFRYLDPDVRGYLTPDPLGVTDRATPWNYTRSPVRAIDPYGLVDPWDIMFSQDSVSDTFQHGPWAGRKVEEAIAEARELGRLPDGLELNAMKVNDEWVTLNNRSLFVAQQANLPHVHVNDVGGSGLNQFNKLQRDAGLSGPVSSVTVRPCK